MVTVFVAGGTGVIGRASLRALAEAGHQVRATARSAEKANLARSLGATPVDVDLYDQAAVRRAIAGSDAVLRLTTKIPALMKMRRRGTWVETARLRTASARILADAALAERVPVFVHESVVFVYADGGSRWLDEDAPTDDGGTMILRATIDGEQEAARFTQEGGRGIVLRFGGFYGPDASSTLETARLLRRRMLPQIGRGANYFSSIYVRDAGRAVAAAISAPAGVYNVCDDVPVTFGEYLSVAAATVGAAPPRRFPVVLGRLFFGETGRYFFRSLRVSNCRFKEATGWAPTMPSASNGWREIAAHVRGTLRGRIR